MLNIFSDAVFAFMPVVLAFTAAGKLRTNPILAVGVALMLVHPNWTALVAAKDPVNFFGIIPFMLTSYMSSVVPILLIVFVQSYVERFLNNVVPKSVNLVFVPMLTFLIMGTLSFFILGPIGAFVGSYLAIAFNYLAVNASWAPAVIVGGLLPIMVMFGIHNAVAPLGVMQLADLGYDSIFGPGCVCSNMAQATAGLVVALRTQDKSFKQIALSGSITAYMGITEPILYGVNLKKKYPLIAAMIGGASGGLFAGLAHTHRFATGSSGLPAVLLYIGDNSLQLLVYIMIAILISMVVSGVLTFALSFIYEKNGRDVLTPQVSQIGSFVGDTAIEAPVSGKVLALQDAGDEAFSSGALGQGVVIKPDNGVVVSPFDGQVTTFFPTQHAIGLLSDNGTEMLIHVGIDTVSLQGACFKGFVSQGDHVTKGQKLLEFDIHGIQKAGYSTETFVLITNSDKYKTINKTDAEQIDIGEKLLALQA
jgi:PTS system beta-glucosides-specific IIC component